ncbi:hypothetical protein SEA_PUREGLOBE5_57 [Arthrobacter phage Pureglobe5]|nr:hypothetical protein PBI_BEAGLE_56 [Arthrobacter phage Beagle]QOP66807.1 hypothetical protein SEA_ODYSSEY395_58 [Arthrobacter phage Odyssey395]UYL87420.1 hypothetical protein SEA_PUREGLOBE5_57 [Arthrobacter phage Pureglobe5]
MKGLSMKVPKKSLAILLAIGTAFAVMGNSCGSDAQTVSDNISKEADQFNVQRAISVLNTRTDKFMFYAEGRCSVERDNGWLVAICRHAADEYRKHLIGPATDAFPLVKQLAPIDVSRYHTLIVMRPEGIIPDIQLRGGQQ